ncbi:MAG: class I SAM-dependent methyltransferase [Proteobacteria bacterium]|nr:class I SAM-dependent methyltransferase [Pseudomonadota bacterium]
MSAGEQYYEIACCRLCGSSAIETVLELTPTPPANNLITAEVLGRVPACYPLEVCRCADCHHLQLRHIVNPELLFSNYLYVSQTSPVMLRHLADQAVALAERIKDSGNKLVIEIGSNDGSLLANFQRLGFPVLGVDPARNIAAQAVAAGVPTIVEFFGEAVGRKLAAKYGRAGLVCANHCFAHIEDIHSVVEGVKHLLDDGAEFVFEVGYLLDVYQKTLFDTIYHEHLDYHHVEPLAGFFASHGMSLVHVERHEIQGGTLRGFARLGHVAPAASIAAFIAAERAAGLDRKETFLRFEASIKALSTDLNRLLGDIAARGGRVYGFGVPAKATTLMYHFAISSELVPVIVDDNPLKQGRYVAGLEIPVTSAQAIYDDRPEYVLILAWNFADSIVARNQAYLESGGTFIVPLPTLRLVDRNGTRPWTAIGEG